MDRVGEEFDGRFGIYVEELNSGAAENNVAAPREVADMLKKIHHGQMLSARSSEEMLGMLKDGRDRRMIPRYGRRRRPRRPSPTQPAAAHTSRADPSAPGVRPKLQTQAHPPTDAAKPPRTA